MLLPNITALSERLASPMESNLTSFSFILN